MTLPFLSFLALAQGECSHGFAHFHQLQYPLDQTQFTSHVFSLKAFKRMDRLKINGFSFDDNQLASQAWLKSQG